MFGVARSAKTDACLGEVERGSGRNARPTGNLTGGGACLVSFSGCVLIRVGRGSHDACEARDW